MTDRYNTLTVVLKGPTRDDDSEDLIKAICMLRGVLSVKGNVANICEYMSESRAKDYWRDKMINLLWPKDEK